MNLKKAKKIRQEFRAQGTDVRQREYKNIVSKRYRDEKGILVEILQTVLAVACPRYQYKKVKEAGWQT
jgi:hypothetical protein